MIDAVHRQVEQVVDDERLGLAALEAPGVDHTGDDDLERVDAGGADHRDEDPVPGEELDDETLHAGGEQAGATLHDDVTQPAHLVARRVEDRQAADA